MTDLIRGIVWWAVILPLLIITMPLWYDRVKKELHDN
jgi:hypothetical protein